MFGGKGRKERKRWMALLLAGAMVLSGMGISPISVQAEETATAVEQVQETEPVETIVEENTEHKFLGIFGEEKVNVLKCNIEIAEKMGVTLDE